MGVKSAATMQEAALLLLLLLAAALTSRAQVVYTNKSAEHMPSVPTSDAQRLVGGYYEPIGQAPVAVAHALQLPCGNKYLMVDYGPTAPLLVPHPPTNPDGIAILQVYDRDADSWTNVPTRMNLICGGWARFANGEVGMFAGHKQTWGGRQVDGSRAIHIFNPSTYSLQNKGSLTARRWYVSTFTLPDGKIYLPGGTWFDNATGVFPKADGADIFTHANNTIKQYPMNNVLYDAGLGNWYMNGVMLPSGKFAAMNARMMQVVDPYTGEAVATAPALPDSVKFLTWEYPRTGAQVVLCMSPMVLGQSQRFEFMAFGGSYVDDALKLALKKSAPQGPNKKISEWKPCADVAVRIGLTMDPSGQHTWDDAWTVEQMPGPRCVFDGVLLPNGHVVLIGGHKVGLADLPSKTGGYNGSYNAGHEPYNEPWIYKPEAPAGQRFMLTGAKTPLARLYHATHLLTSEGDIVVGGTSNAAFFQSSHPADFSKTPVGVSEFRMEVYHPPYQLQQNRPRFTSSPPTFVTYGEQFEVGYAFDVPADITRVALVNAGGVTHGYNIGHRSQLLRFTATKSTDQSGTIRIEVPPAPEYAPPHHYMLFLLSGDTYSKAAWVQLRRDPKTTVPVDFPQEAVFIPEYSNTFDQGTNATYGMVKSPLRSATANLQLQEARGTGSSGARVSIAASDSGGQVLLKSLPRTLLKSSVCYVQFWAKPSLDAPFAVELVRVADGSRAANQNFNLKGGSYCLHVFGPISPKISGQHAIQIQLGGSKEAVSFDIDDVEVYCTKV